MPFLGQKKKASPLNIFFCSPLFFSRDIFLCALAAPFFLESPFSLQELFFALFLTKFRHFADLTLIFCHFFLQKKQLPLLALVLFFELAYFFLRAVFLAPLFFFLALGSNTPNSISSITILMAKSSDKIMRICIFSEL